MEVAASAAEVVQRCPITFSMLSDIHASEAVYDNSSNGIITAVSEGKVIVDCSTISPERMAAVAFQVGMKGGRFLEAPVSGSKVPAETGQLIFLCAGDRSAYDEVEGYLKAMGKANFYLGEVGQGSKMKLAVNMVMGSMMAAFGEGMLLCESARIDREQFLQVLDLGAMSNPMFRGKGPNIIKGVFDAHFPLKHAQKDMK